MSYTSKLPSFGLGKGKINQKKNNQPVKKGIKGK